MNKVSRHIASRLASLAPGLEPTSRSAAMSLMARVVRGEPVAPAEFAALHGGRESPRGLRIGIAQDEAGGLGLSLVTPYEMIGDGVGLMRIDGPVMRNPSLFDVLFFGEVPQDLLAEAFNRAADDENLKTLVVAQDCPGGSVYGLSEVGAAFDRLAASGKRTIAFASDMIASAAWWWSALCDEVVVTPTSVVGSIGTIMPFYDDSEMFRDLGVVPRFIASSERKGVGMPGVALTDDLTSDQKRITEKHFEEFAARVAAGRGVTPEHVKGLDARMYLGSDAVAAKLADRVVPSMGEFLGIVVRETADAAGAVGGGADPSVTPNPPQLNKENPVDLKNLTMADLTGSRKDLVDQIKNEGRAEALAEVEKTRPKPASIADLRGAFPGDENATFREDCSEKTLTLDQAKAAHAGILSQRVESLNAQLGVLKAENDQLRSLNNNGRGVSPLPHLNRETGAPAADSFEGLVQAAVKAGKPLNQAIVDCIAAHPKAHEQWIVRGCPKISAAA